MGKEKDRPFRLSQSFPQPLPLPRTSFGEFTSCRSMIDRWSIGYRKFGIRTFWFASAAHSWAPLHTGEFPTKWILVGDRKPESVRHRHLIPGKVYLFIVLYIFINIAAARSQSEKRNIFCENPSFQTRWEEVSTVPMHNANFESTKASLFPSVDNSDCTQISQRQY